MSQPQPSEPEHIRPVWDGLAADAGATPMVDHDGRAVGSPVAGHEPASSARGKRAVPGDRSDRSDRSAGIWPDAPAGSVFLGLAGDIVAAIEPHTEGDPLAILAQTLVMFGCAVGRGPHAMVGATRHGVNTNVMVVGDTAKARKGDSLAPVKSLFGLADADWSQARILSGFGSGEGLVWAVRDPSTRMEPVRQRGRIIDHQTVMTDEGASDKRLLVVEPEVARILRVAARQGNVLSMIMRDAWDGGDLAVITKGASLRATGAHVSAIGHITADELRRELSDTEAANGFANRWLVILARRSKLLPEPDPFEGREVESLARQLRDALAVARTRGRIERSGAARDLWAEVYPLLSKAHAGLAGAIVARAEAQVLRLSLIFALLDRSELVEPAHLTAALELWGYAERSAQFLFGKATGSALADRVLHALQDAQELTRTQIRDLLGRHTSEAAIKLALDMLQACGLVRVQRRRTGGRSAEVWSCA